LNLRTLPNPKHGWGVQIDPKGGAGVEVTQIAERGVGYIKRNGHARWIIRFQINGNSGCCGVTTGEQ